MVFKTDNQRTFYGETEFTQFVMIRMRDVQAEGYLVLLKNTIEMEVENVEAYFKRF